MSLSSAGREALDRPRTRAESRGDIIAAYVALTKPRIMSLLLFTTLAALLVAASEVRLSTVDFWRTLAATLVGGALASGGASALNCYIDRDIDVVMGRTRWRAIPAGLVTPPQVLAFGLILTALSVTVFALLTTPLATVLALSGNVFYVVIYTGWLKRRTTQNIVIGGVAGAIPPLVGWSAVTGTIGLPAFLLFVIITYWTPAHFWSLALLIRRDYSRAQIPMLPSVTNEAHASWQILIYTLLVVIASLMLFSAHVMGALYLVIAVALGAGFIAHACLLVMSYTPRRAWRTFLYSNMYLAALFGAMILDSIIRVRA